MNAVTGPHRDSVVGTPESKLTAVRVEQVTVPNGGADAGA